MKQKDKNRLIEKILNELCYSQSYDKNEIWRILEDAIEIENPSLNPMYRKVKKAIGIVLICHIIPVTFLLGTTGGYSWQFCFFCGYLLDIIVIFFIFFYIVLHWLFTDDWL